MRHRESTRFKCPFCSLQYDFNEVFPKVLSPRSQSFNMRNSILLREQVLLILRSWWNVIHEQLGLRIILKF